MNISIFVIVVIATFGFFCAGIFLFAKAFLVLVELFTKLNIKVFVKLRQMTRLVQVVRKNRVNTNKCKMAQVNMDNQQLADIPVFNDRINPDDDFEIPAYIRKGTKLVW